MPRIPAAARPAKPAEQTGELTYSEPALADPPPPPKQTALQFTSLAEADEKINILYYGREGTGKTTDAAAITAIPQPGRLLVVNAEGGLKRSALTRRGIDSTRIVTWPPTGTPITFDGLEAVHRQVLGDLQDDPDSWLGVAFDSITEIVGALRELATDRRRQKLTNRGVTFDEEAIDRDDYGVMTDQVRRLLRRYRDLPCHFIVTALERANDDPTRGPVGVGPAVNPALATDLLGYMDFVLYCRATIQATGEDAVEGGDTPLAEFRAITRPHTRYRAKDRFDVLPRVLADPTFVRLYGYTTGDLQEDDDPIQAAYVQRRAEQAVKDAAAAAEKAARKVKKGAATATAA